MGTPNLLAQPTVAMTVLAQDRTVTSTSEGTVGGPLLATIPVPAGRLARGPCTHRFRVVDDPDDPVVLHHDGDPWAYVDRWARHQDGTAADVAAVLADPAFRAQHVLAVASHTLALVERHLGRPVAWHTGVPQLELRLDASDTPRAAYSRDEVAICFGRAPRPLEDAPLDSALSFDVVAHEVTHAILDGLRPRYAEPGPPDQLAFHEALGDLVALLSVFTVDDVTMRLLTPNERGRVAFASPAAADRADELRRPALLTLAEELGRRSGAAAATRALRTYDDAPGPAWRTDPDFAEPHRRAEIMVAAVVRTLVAMWAERLDPLEDDGEGLDADRVAEEGSKSAEHLLGMLLRALDYLPPVELEFEDVLSAVLLADERLAPDDRHGYRSSLAASFAAYGIEPARLVDPVRRRTAADPDATTAHGLRYEHVNRAAMRASPEEVHEFVWNNAAVLDLDVRHATRVERVVASTRVGPDGLVVEEVVADYTQLLDTTAAGLRDLPGRIRAPRGTPAETPVRLRGGGVLVFDEFGRFRWHLRKPLLDAERQVAMLRRPDPVSSSAFGIDEPAGAVRRLQALHPSQQAEVEQDR